MPGWAWLLVGLFTGSPVGYFTAILMVSAARRDGTL
jgi:hypothetical protein